LTSGERIEISFRTNSSQRFDALQVLSEGHIRCLGLAMLIAKNIKLNCPFLLFDDPVNAIDHDHRDAIRRVLRRWPSSRETDYPDLSRGGILEGHPKPLAARYRSRVPQIQLDST
jgi:ABC-type cobalamin/Fe3+-siderophores transport system ATPase subunit